MIRAGLGFLVVVVLLGWNPADLTAKEVGRGEVIYRGFCIVCHGPEGRGDGISSPALLPAPPDFSSQEFKESFEKDRAWEAVLNGKPETQMEGFKEKLSPEDVEAVIEYILSF